MQTDDNGGRILRIILYKSFNIITREARFQK